MTDINALTRQPEEIDYSAPSQYRFSIIQLPKVQFFTTACNIPGVNMGDAIFPTPFKDIPVLPDKVTFENLEITFQYFVFLFFLVTKIPFLNFLQ